MPNLPNGRSKIIGWTDPTQTIISSDLGNGTSGNSLLTVNNAGSTLSFKEGNPSFAQTLANLEQNKVYLLQATRNLTLASTVKGFGGSSPAPSPSPTPSPSGARTLNTASPLYSGLRMYYLGEENKELVTGTSGNLVNDSATPSFTYPTVSNRKFIQATTVDDFVMVPISGGAAKNYTDFTIFHFGEVLESSSGFHAVISLYNGDPVSFRLAGYLDPGSATAGNGIVTLNESAAPYNLYFGNQFDKTFRFYAVRRTGTTLDLFIDGTLVQTATVANESLPVAGNMILGRVSPWSWANSKAILRTQVAGLYDRALTNTEITSMNTNPLAVLN